MQSVRNVVAPCGQRYSNFIFVQIYLGSMLIKSESRILYMVRSYVWAMAVKAVQPLFENVLNGLIDT